MATTRSRHGAHDPSDRRHVGMTMPRSVKERALAAAEVLEWSVGDWVLAAAAEHGARLRELLQGREVRKRPAVPEATFTALYLTPEERAELDDQAVTCRLNRSAFVTGVAQLALGDEPARVVAPLVSSSPTRAERRTDDGPVPWGGDERA